MIIFYTQNKPVYTEAKVAVCDSVCSTNCIKPKSKCCHKYKKKGINCKRCPQILLKGIS